MGLKLSHVLGGVLELLGTNSASSRTITFPDKDMTVAGTNDVIGVGQTWQDLTASRALATLYTNDTGKPIQISVYNPYDAVSKTLTLTVDGIIIIKSNIVITGNKSTHASAIIPNGSTYQVDGATLEMWAELR